MLVLEQDSNDTDEACRLIELYRAFPPKNGKPWKADQASVFDLGQNLPQRPDGWTSADAAGLPILPGLVRYDEVEAGFVDHAIRITFERTRRAYLSPASHFASDECGATLPPMGMRLRLREGYELGGMSPEARTIAQALKTYGAIVADNGSNFYITGASDTALGRRRALRPQRRCRAARSRSSTRAPSSPTTASPAYFQATQARCQARRARHQAHTGAAARLAVRVLKA